MFVFPLEALLQHRRRIEESRQKELAKLEALQAAEEEKMARIHAAQRGSAEQLARIQSRPAPAGDIQMCIHYIGRLGIDEKAQQMRLTQFQKQVDTKRLELVEAVKQRKILEKLKERRAKAYLEAQARKEQNFLNEIAISRFNRNRGE